MWIFLALIRKVPRLAATRDRSTAAAIIPRLPDLCNVPQAHWVGRHVVRQAQERELEC